MIRKTTVWVLCCALVAATPLLADSQMMKVGLGEPDPPVYAKPAEAESLIVEFVDPQGNVMIGCHAAVYNEHDFQKFQPTPDGRYEVVAEPGSKMTFVASDSLNKYTPQLLTLPDVFGPDPFRITLFVPAGSATCAQAEPISLGDTVAGDTTGAGYDPNTPAVCGTGIDDLIPSNWYELTIPVGDGDRLIEVSTCNQAAYDTKISVFCMDCDSANFTCVGGNDDGPGCAGFTSYFTFAANEGATYHILVHGFAGASGTYNLSVSDLGSATANDDCIVVGACCFDNCDILDGQVEEVVNECEEISCEILSEADCVDQGGTYNGDATECIVLGDDIRTYASSPALAIPDNDLAGVFDEIEIADEIEIEDLDVELDIRHTWIGDLIVDIEHVDTGTTVRLWNQNCNAQASSGMTITSDDEGTQMFCGPPGGETTGDIMPGIVNGQTSFLSDFDGESTVGTWRLTVSDNFGADVGTLANWALVVNEEVLDCEDCTPGTDPCDEQIDLCQCVPHYEGYWCTTVTVGLCELPDQNCPPDTLLGECWVEGYVH